MNFHRKCMLYVKCLSLLRSSEGKGGRGEAEQRLPSFMIDFFIKDQGSRTKAGGRTWRLARQDPEDQGSRIKDHGPCFGTNEHPRRDTDVILRQSKAPIEIFNSR